MEIDNKIKEQIKMHSLIDKPRECCGFIFWNEGKNRQEIYKCKNIAENPVNFVEVDSREYLLVKEQGEIICFYHSHNKKDKLSAVDESEQKFNNLNYLVYDIQSDSFLWNRKQNKFNSYVNRKFKIGKSDCFNLVCDFYLKELKINILDPIPNRVKDWYKNPKNYILDNINKTNFYIVADKSIKLYDIIVMDYGDSRWHFGIYLDDGLILHHPNGELSKIEEFKESYKKLVKYILRDANR